jgi:hypothetical protein
MHPPLARVFGPCFDAWPKNILARRSNRLALVIIIIHFSHANKGKA